MLTVICGEDSSSSRDYFFNLKKQLQGKDYETYDVPAIQINEVLTWMSEANSLFSKNIAFFTQNLNKTISRKANLKQTKIVEKIIKDNGVEVYTWEQDLPGRYLKISAGVKVKEFKPSQTIFKLLDACYPGNLKTFIEILHSLNVKTDDFFTFVMLQRHIRNLWLIKLNQPKPGLPSWQVARLKNQASHWKTEQLTNFYDGLNKIDAFLKTSRLPYSLSHALDILAAYYL